MSSTEVIRRLCISLYSLHMKMVRQALTGLNSLAPDAVSVILFFSQSMKKTSWQHCTNTTCAKDTHTPTAATVTSTWKDRKSSSPGRKVYTSCCSLKKQNQ